MTHRQLHPRRGLRHPALLAWLALSLLVFATPVAAEVSVEMDASPAQVPLGAPVRVNIRVSSDSLSGPEIQLPDFDGFEILQKSVSRPMQFNLGLGGNSVRSEHNYTFTLRAVQAGTFELGPTLVRVDGETTRSNTVELLVADTGQGDDRRQAQPGAPAAETPATSAERQGEYLDAMEVDPVAFIRTVVDKPQPFVREQVTVTVYLYIRERLQAAPSIDMEPSTDGFWVHDLMQTYRLQAQARQVVGRTRYNVYVLRRFAAFPLKPGTATIGPLALTINRANLLDTFFGRGPRGPIERSGKPIELEVRPLPEGPDPGQVAVGAVGIEAKLDRTQVATGDAVTLTATIEGSGQLQTLTLPKPAVEGLDVFEPQVRDLVESPEDRVGGTRAYEWLVVPRRPGTYRIPPFTLTTFDPAKGTYAEVSSEALTLTAAGSGAQAAAAEPTDPEPSPEAPDTQAAQGDSLELPPLHSQSALVRDREPVSKSGFYVPALLCAPGLWCLVLLGSAVRRRVASRSQTGTGRIQREVRSHLDAAKLAAGTGDSRATFAAIAGCLHAAIEGAAGEPIGSHTRGQLDALLQARGLDTPIRKATLDLLERCDFARFSAEAEGEQALQQAIAEAQQLARSIMSRGVSA